MAASIKGLAIAGLVEDLSALLASGTVTCEELGKHLAEDELALLDGQLDGIRWYPIATYEALTTALLQATHSAGKNRLRARGEAAANRLLEMGLYQQLDALAENSSWTRENFASSVRLIATLHGSLLNFSVWTVEVDPVYPARIQLTVTQAAEFPEMLRIVTEGFMNACTVAASGNTRWLSERTAPDCIVFRMDRDFRPPADPV